LARVGGGPDRMTASMPPGSDLEYRLNGDEYDGNENGESIVVPARASMTESTYYPQREGQPKLPPIPPSSSDGDLGYLSNNSDGGVGNSHSKGAHNGMVDRGGEAILAKFCHACGTRFPISWARFCCMCGEKRLWMNPADRLPAI